MPELGRFTRELRSRLWKPSVDDEVSSEIEHHIEMLERDLIAQGLAPDAARRAARERFGDTSRIGDECRDLGTLRDRETRRAEWLAEWRQDARYALRQLRASPRFALVAITTLAIGLGASTTIFGIANAVLLRPLPFHDPSRLVLIDEINPEGQPFAISEPNFLDVRSRVRTLSGLAAFAPRSPSLLGDGAPERLRGLATTSSLFDVLGVAPALGRTFAADEDRRGGDVRVAVVSDGLWRRRFGADPRVLGSTIDLDGVRHRVVGVMPAGFEFPGRTDVWVPLAPDATSPRGDRRLEAVGRLAPGATRAQANQEIAAIAEQLAATYPTSNGAWKAQVRAFEEWYVSPTLRARVVALLATVGLLVLMACVNVASLLLARAGVRQREIAVRAALGAGRRRIIRQLLTESLVLAAIGATLGAMLAAAATPVIRRVGSAAVPLLATMTLDWRVLGFALASCVTTGIVFGLAPALRLARSRAGGESTHDILRSGTRFAGGGAFRRALIAASVALAMVMLVSATLVGRSFVRLMRTDLGFSAEHVLAASIVLPEEKYDFERSAGFFSQLVPRLAAIPGVRAAGAVNLAPFSGGNTGMDFVPGTHAPTDPSDYRSAAWRAITPGYFATLGIPLVRGRVFDAHDVYPSPDAIIINAAMARVGWPGADPIGAQVTLANGRTMTVVGVVGDTRALAIDSAAAPTMYFAHGQFPWQAMWLTVRTTGDPMTALAAVEREVHALDPDIPLARAQPLTRLVDDVAAEPRLTMLVFGIFATAALVLAAVGLYGLVSYTVAQRTREIGVRLALGAAPSQVARAVVRDGLALAAVGVAIGAVVSFGAGRALRAILYETEPTDAITFVAVALVLVMTAMLASLAPARRASKLEPVAALRAE